MCANKPWGGTTSLRSAESDSLTFSATPATAAPLFYLPHTAAHRSAPHHRRVDFTTKPAACSPGRAGAHVFSSNGIRASRGKSSTCCESVPVLTLVPFVPRLCSGSTRTDARAQRGDLLEKCARGRALRQPTGVFHPSSCFAAWLGNLICTKSDLSSVIFFFFLGQFCG